MKRRQFMGFLGGAGIAGSAASPAAAGLLLGSHQRIPLLIGGSSTMLHFTRALVDGFARQNTLVDAVVEGGGSLPGLVALKRGAIDLAAMSTDLTVEQDEIFIRNYLVAKDCLGIVVHPSNPVHTLSRAQARDIFTGEIRNWRALGGPDAPILPYVRPRRATTQIAADSLILDGHDLADEASVVEESAELVSVLESNPHAVGYLSLHRFTPKVKVLPVDGIDARRETILSGRYPFTRSFFYVLRSDSPPAAQDFLSYAIGPKGRDILSGLDIVPAF